jgi:hypothetical protein
MESKQKLGKLIEVGQEDIFHQQNAIFHQLWVGGSFQMKS